MDPIVDQWEIHRPEPMPPVSERTPSPAPAPEVERTPVPTTRTPRTPPASIQLDRLFLHRRGQLTWDQMTGFRGGAQRTGLRLMAWSFVAALIDALILASASSFFLIAFAMIVKNPVAIVLKSALALGAWRLFLVVLVGLSWLYLVGMRVAFGHTIGEWACDLRLGQPSERRRKTYPLRVLWRATLMIMTGGLPLSALSLLFGRDLAGSLSGIKLISLR